MFNYVCLSHLHITLVNPFHTNPLVVVYGMGGGRAIRPPPPPANISAPDGARRLFFWYNMHLSKINE